MSTRFKQPEDKQVIEPAAEQIVPQQQDVETIRPAVTELSTVTERSLEETKTHADSKFNSRLATKLGQGIGGAIFSTCLAASYFFTNGAPLVPPVFLALFCIFGLFLYIYSAALEVKDTP